MMAVAMLIEPVPLTPPEVRRMPSAVRWAVEEMLATLSDLDDEDRRCAAAIVALTVRVGLSELVRWPN
jgi:hypothetical protein